MSEIGPPHQLLHRSKPDLAKERPRRGVSYSNQTAIVLQLMLCELESRAGSTAICATKSE